MTAVVLAGMLAGLGVALLLTWAARPEPDLAAALDRLDPHRAPGQHLDPAPPAGDLMTRLGLWAHRRAPTRWVRVPAADLNVLGMSPAAFWGKKAALLLIGLAFPTLFTVVVGAIGLNLPLILPVAAGLVLGVGAVDGPGPGGRNATPAAAPGRVLPRVTFTSTWSPWRRTPGRGPARLSSRPPRSATWVFVRLREELAHSRWAGRPAWDALSDLGDELGSPACTTSATSCACPVRRAPRSTTRCGPAPPPSRNAVLRR